MLALLADIVVAARGARAGSTPSPTGAWFPTPGTPSSCRACCRSVRSPRSPCCASASRPRTSTRRGALSRLVDPEQVVPTAKELADRLAEGPTRSLGLAKALYRRALSSDMATAFRERGRGGGHDLRDGRPSGRGAVAQRRAPSPVRRRVGDAVKDATAIVGIGQTPFAKELPGTEVALACQAIRAALEDAGISPSEVDGLASSRSSRWSRWTWPATSGSATSGSSARSATAAGGLRRRGPCRHGGGHGSRPGRRGVAGARNGGRRTGPGPTSSR